MKKLLRWKWELLLLLVVGIMGGLLSYWLTANPTSSFVRFLLSVGIFADGGFAVLVLRRLWRDKWKQALAKGSQVIASVKTGRMGWFDDVPQTPVVIEKMEIIER